MQALLNRMAVMRTGFALAGVSFALVGVPASGSAEGSSAASVQFARASDIIGDPVAVYPSRPLIAPPGQKQRAEAPQPDRGASAVSWPQRAPLRSSAMTSGFGARRHPIMGGLRNHSGVDMAAQAGAPVYAPAAGVVRYAQWYGGFGLFVVIDHGQGLFTRYGHLSRINVVPGQRVEAGEVLAFVGSTGLSTGPHLHYEVWINGTPVDPARFVPVR